MKKLKLPLNIDDFASLREDGYYYVDKTDDIYRLTADRGCYFLLRPRRFGKSLIISTLKHLLEGHESLFRGLAIHKQWDWSQKHAVVRISFNRKYTTTEDIEGDLLDQFNRIRKTAASELSPPPSSSP